MKVLPTLLALLVLAVPARAHRLDEYLQATRVALSVDRIELRIDLTPGVAVLPELLPLMGPAVNGRFNRKEQMAYAHRVLTDLNLELDHRQVPIKLAKLTFPNRAEMEAGEGVIRLVAVAKTRKIGPGAHEVFFNNSHLPKMSVYLVNALQPADRHLSILSQTRDERQRQYWLKFERK